MTKLEEFLELKKSVDYQLRHIPDGIPCRALDNENVWCFRTGNKIGIAIDTGEKNFQLGRIGIGREFEMSSRVNLLDESGNFLTLTVDKRQIDDDVDKRNICATILCYFAQSENRDSLLKDPKTWARQMIDVLGNAAIIEKPHPYIAELYAVNKLLGAGLILDVEKEYLGPESAVHDIETADFSLEVKSHLYGDPDTRELVVSSLHQLLPTEKKPLYVVYFQMGKSGSLTLENMVKDFVAQGQQKIVALEKLKESGGFSENDLVWDEPYHLQGEPQVYKVDENFPRITDEQIPTQWHNSISNLHYKVSLANIPSCDFKDFVAAKRAGREPEFKANIPTGAEN